MKIEPKFHIAVTAMHKGIDLNNYPPLKPCICGSSHAFLNCCMLESPKFLMGRFTRLGMSFLTACKRGENETAKALAGEYNDTLKVLKLILPGTYGKMTTLKVRGLI